MLSAEGIWQTASASEKGRVNMTANKKVSFGFGTMRLPLVDPGDPTSFDFDRIQALFELPGAGLSLFRHGLHLSRL